MRIVVIIFICQLFNFPSFANLVKPNPDIKPDKVIDIQLNALMNNDLPFLDAGITQTWEFAHPNNRQYTGPLSNFALMMKSDLYSSMLNHQSHKIIFVSMSKNTANYFVELTDKIGNKFGFTWTVKKVLKQGEFKDCWMTSGVSKPMPLAKSV